MKTVTPSTLIKSDSFGECQLSSILIEEAANLTKRNGGGVRSRVMLSCLQELGEVDVISIVTKPHHVARVPKVEGVRSHEIIVVKSNKFAEIQRTIFALLKGRKTLSPETPRDDAVLKHITSLSRQHQETRLLAFRYFGAWKLSGCQDNKITQHFTTWIDLDDRADKILGKKRETSPFGLLRRLAPKIEALAKSEIEAAAQACCLCSLAAASDTVDFATGANVVTLSNVVPTPDGAAFESPPSKGTSLLFVGSYIWPPNIDAIEWFIIHCWDRILAERPLTKLDIVGSGTRSTFDALTKKFSNRDGIEWHFNVPELDTYYASARAVISPVRLGSGSKIKVIEAAAYGRPTVVTSHSARGLASDITDALAIADSGEGFAKSCLSYMSNPAKADIDGAALRIAQEKHHSINAFKHAAFQALDQAAIALNISNLIKSNLDHATQQTNEVQQ
jgi:hypothetical protein